MRQQTQGEAFQCTVLNKDKLGGWWCVKYPRKSLTVTFDVIGPGGIQAGIFVCFAHDDLLHLGTR